MRIVAEHLSYTYNARSPFETAALKDVSLTIEEGEFFGIIGHTGSGKSTFVQHLNGLLRLPSSMKKYRPKKPKKGQVLPPAPVLRVGDFDLADKKTDFRALRRNVGMVFQYPEYQLFAETVRDDVAFGLKNFSEKKLSDEQIDLAVKAALEVVGLDYAQIKDKSPFELSGGQKRRVAIAGVIAMEPEVVIFDEPTAGLDPAGCASILGNIRDYQKATHATVLMVTHSMDEVAQLADRMLVLNEGTIEMSGTPREVFSHAARLAEIGLSVPQVTALFLRLRELGVDVDPTTFIVEQAVPQLRALLEGRAHA